LNSDTLPGFFGNTGGRAPHTSGGSTGAGSYPSSLRADVLPGFVSAPAGRPGPSIHEISGKMAHTYLEARGVGDVRREREQAQKENKVWNYTKSIPYNELQVPSKWTRPDIDVCNREKYLSDAEFKQFFKMDKATFDSVPQWKKNVIKKSLGLY
jgi:hypothetical protein